MDGCVSTAVGARLSRGVRAVVLLIAVVASTGLTAALIGSAAKRVAGDRMAPWILGRAAGICSYLLLVVLVLTGMLLSHPWRTRVRRPNTATRIRVHVALAAFTLVFTALHVIVLATDSYAGVGWWGALLPLHASYRPVATTLGLSHPGRIQLAAGGVDGCFRRAQTQTRQQQAQAPGADACNRLEKSKGYPLSSTKPIIPW